MASWSKRTSRTGTKGKKANRLIRRTTTIKNLSREPGSYARQSLAQGRTPRVDPCKPKKTDREIELGKRHALGSEISLNWNNFMLTLPTKSLAYSKSTSAETFLSFTRMKIQYLTRFKSHSLLHESRDWLPSPRLLTMFAALSEVLCYALILNISLAVRRKSIGAVVSLMFHEMGAESLQYWPHFSDTSSSATRLVPKGHAGQWSLGIFFPYGGKVVLYLRHVRFLPRGSKESL